MTFAAFPIRRQPITMESAPSTRRTAGAWPTRRPPYTPRMPRGTPTAGDNSKELQSQGCQRYCATKGIEIATRYHDRAGSREDFERMMDDATQDEPPSNSLSSTSSATSHSPLTKPSSAGTGSGPAAYRWSPRWKHRGRPNSPWDPQPPLLNGSQIDDGLMTVARGHPATLW